MREYLKDPEFVRRYDTAVASLIDEATKQAQKSLSPAILALLDIVNDQEQPASVRVSAARSLLEYGLRFTEFNDILRDLERLEGSCTTTT